MLSQALVLAAIGVTVVFAVLGLNYGLIKIIGLLGEKETPQTANAIPVSAPAESETLEAEESEQEKHAQEAEQYPVENTEPVIEKKLAAIIASAVQQYEAQVQTCSIQNDKVIY